MIHSLDDNNSNPFGDNLDPSNIMLILTDELASSLKSMSKAKKIDEKLQHSQIVKNLCDSLGVFFNIASSAIPGDFMDEFDDDDFDDDDEDF